MKFTIKNRYTGEPVLITNIEAKKSDAYSIQLGLAVRAAAEVGASLRNADLREADLSDANLTGVVLRGADLSGAVLRNTNLTGSDLSDTYMRSVYMRGVDLSNANIRDANWRTVDLTDAKLCGANLSGASLRGADMSGVNLVGANLEGIDLRDCPVKINNIHQTIYAVASQDGCLDMSTWHCGTAHCRAGWVVTLAGEGGNALEWTYGTSAAASIIYIASDLTLKRVPDFYCDNETALADMKRLAELEAERAGVK